MVQAVYDNIISPEIATDAPASYDFSYQRSRIDSYLLFLFNRAALADDRHPTAPLAANAGYAGGTAPNTIAAQQARIDAVTVLTVTQTAYIAHGRSDTTAGLNTVEDDKAAGVEIADMNRTGFVGGSNS
ncbi:hypothetical protein EAH87_14710 [Sphingomonas koreensis]|nr:hypothetical protein EAH87_14710 [Sphingomonas koreensis]